MDVNTSMQQPGFDFTYPPPPAAVPGAAAGPPARARPCAFGASGAYSCGHTADRRAPATNAPFPTPRGLDAGSGSGDVHVSEYAFTYDAAGSDAARAAACGFDSEGAFACRRK